MTVCWIQGALDRSFPESLIIIFFIFCYKQGTPSPMTSGVIMTTAECQIARHVELSPLEKIEKQKTVIRGFRHAVAKSGLSYGLTANSIANSIGLWPLFGVLSELLSVSYKSRLPEYLPLCDIYIINCRLHVARISGNSTEDDFTALSILSTQ